MYTSMCFVSVVAVLVAEVRTGALLQKDAEFRRCAQCAADADACAASRRAPTPCAARGLRCATVAVAPEFTSVLTCASATVHQPCSLHHSPQQALALTCTCPGHGCNAPFTAQLRNHLLNFTSSLNSTTNLTDTFFKSFSNASKDKLYDMITSKALQDNQSNNTPPVTFSSTAVEHFNGLNAPRAEALKHEATEPSDDEEDEGEGSGSYEETRLRRPAAAPAAPSSYLPANENAAPPLLVNFLLMTGILFVTL